MVSIITSLSRPLRSLLSCYNSEIFDKIKTNFCIEHLAHTDTFSIRYAMRSPSSTSPGIVIKTSRCGHNLANTLSHRVHRAGHARWPGTRYKFHHHHVQGGQYWRTCSGRCSRRSTSSVCCGLWVSFVNAGRNYQREPTEKKEKVTSNTT